MHSLNKHRRVARAGARTLVLATVLAGSLTASAQATPAGSDFELALPKMQKVESTARASAHAGESPITSRSPVIDTPQSFDMAGLANELRALEMRARPTGGDWTDWTETADGDPVFFGDADQLQVRARGWTPRGRLHFVDIQGSSEPASELAARRGGSGMPNVVSRQSWGANNNRGGCKPRTGAEYGKVKAAVVHHTVSAVDYAERDAPGMVLGICRYHRNTNGWNDIGYNAVIDRFGNIYEGRAGGLSRAVVGAQAEGWNSQTTGVAMLGTHTSTPITNNAMKALTKWLAWKLPTHERDADSTVRMKSAGGSTNRYPAGTNIRVKTIVGHRRLNSTACPGDALDRQLGDVRAKTQRKIQAR